MAKKGRRDRVRMVSRSPFNIYYSWSFQLVDQRI